MSTGPQKPNPDFVPGRKHRSRESQFAWEQTLEKARTPALMLVAAALAVLVAWLFTGDRRTTRQTEEVLPFEQTEVLRRRSLDLEASFEKIRLERTELLPADIDLLAKALAVHEEYIAARGAVGTDNGRLDALRRRLHVIHGEQLRIISDRAEAQALIDAKDRPDAAIAGLRRALECEKEIEEKWVYSGLGEQGRIARLDTRLRRLESEPLWRTGRELEKAGDDLEAAGKFDEAAAKYVKAIETENQFLERYRDVRDTEFRRVETLSAKRETALSGNFKKLVDEQRAIAEAHEKKGSWALAAEAWKQAIEAFNDLLTQYPHSRHADRAQEAVMVRRLNYAAAYDDIAKVRAGLARMREQLRAHRTDSAASMASGLLSVARALAEKNTGVFLPADPERRELEFVVEREATVRTLANTLDASLIAIPGTKVRLYKQEVSQGLYGSVMGVNPSSLQKEAHPVESVSYQDALEFCTRLGWATGSRVRLPSLEEFTLAVGDVTKAPDARHAWTFENTDGVNTKPAGQTEPNALGFRDLLGNVEEWLRSPADEPAALVAGGSVAWSAAPGVPSRKVNKRDKSRTLGFRIVVE